MVKVRVYIEGGGANNKSLNIELREGFRNFIGKTGISPEKIQFIAGFGREHTFTFFRRALDIPNTANLLLIDSESAIRDSHTCDKNGQGGLPWEHLKLRAGDKHWQKPAQADNSHCHFMVECMENWFLADTSALELYFGRSFQKKHLPGQAAIESVSKSAVLSALKKASRNCTKQGEYDKGKHSFKILARIDATRVVASSPWARRFVQTLKEHTDSMKG